MSAAGEHCELYSSAGDQLVAVEVRRAARARTLAGYFAAEQLADLQREHDELLAMLERAFAAEFRELVAVFECAERELRT